MMIGTIVLMDRIYSIYIGLLYRNKCLFVCVFFLFLILRYPIWRSVFVLFLSRRHSASLHCTWRSKSVTWAPFSWFSSHRHSTSSDVTRFRKRGLVPASFSLFAVNQANPHRHNYLCTRTWNFSYIRLLFAKLCSKHRYHRRSNSLYRTITWTPATGRGCV